MTITMMTKIGAGKSEGKLSATMTKDFERFMESVGMSLGRNVDSIIWARGMATGVAIEYLANEAKLEAMKPKNFTESVRIHPKVIYTVLDTPFESIKLMIDSCIKKLKSSGNDVPDTIISLFSGFARRTISYQLSGDPFAIEPIQHVKNINTPCMILIAENDDYIPLEQCLHIVESW